MPVVKQLSVFLANKPGVLARLCETFADHKINIQGLSVSDTVDHAVVRMITSNPEKARAVLEDAAVLVVETDVLALKLPDRPGQLAMVAERLSKAKINIEYAYGTTGSSGARLVLRVSDTKKAMKILKVK
jgi:hypothetical protein